MKFLGVTNLLLLAVSSYNTADALLQHTQPRPTFMSSVQLKRSTKLKVASAEQEEHVYNLNDQPEVVKTGESGAMSQSQVSVQKNLNLGAPPKRPAGGHYLTKGGVQITSNVTPLEYSSVPSGTGDNNNALTSADKIEEIVDRLNNERGVLLTSSYEFPGRYKRWSYGFVNPPLEVSGNGNDCTIVALNERGRILIKGALRAMEMLENQGALESIDTEMDGDENLVKISVKVVAMNEVGSFSEEDRSRQPSLFSVVRALIDVFGFDSPDQQLGLYGAFGYDLTFQFEPIDIKQERDPEQRDLLLYLPDEILVVDQDSKDAWIQSYDFCIDGESTTGLSRTGPIEEFSAYDGRVPFESRDTPENEFAQSVERAKHEFKVGNLFEAVLSQTFRHKLDEQTPPSTLFRRLRARNPSPYGFLINLGEEEYLIGASPEMFVRCQQTPNLENPGGPALMRVETCPISGTVARGADALEDAQRVKSLIINTKEESELTMCTDVDRNDKSRICIPGSVQVIGRRQIEMYSRLIHTVDHVEGYLRPEFDALDAFLCHTWAVTVTGAPKTWAIQFVEDMERSPRCWYGGAVGMAGFDGGMNTGLTLRTVRVKSGVAEVRAGATLLFDSSPEAEELETELKASAMIDAIVRTDPESSTASTTTSVIPQEPVKKAGEGKKIILVDHEDSFVHTLGNYLRQTGAEVSTLRSGPKTIEKIEKLAIDGNAPDMVVLSPGPGSPSDFGLSNTLDILEKYKIPGFGVCLGLQGMVEYFGGELGVLGYPMHGKPSEISLTADGQTDSSIFYSLPETFEVARYHSLHGIKDKLPESLSVTALTSDGIVMGIQHKTMPYAAVQFHPESIMTNPKFGMKILENALTSLKYQDNE